MYAISAPCVVFCRQYLVVRPSSGGMVCCLSCHDCEYRCRASRKKLQEIEAKFGVVVDVYFLVWGPTLCLIRKNACTDGKKLIDQVKRV